MVSGLFIVPAPLSINLSLNKKVIFAVGDMIRVQGSRLTFASRYASMLRAHYCCFTACLFRYLNGVCKQELGVVT